MTDKNKTIAITVSSMLNSPFSSTSETRGPEELVCINDALTDDTLLHVLYMVAQDGVAPSQAKHFTWMRRTLPRVCSKWNELLDQPTCPVWRTLHVNVKREHLSASSKGAKRSVSSVLSTGTSPPGASFLSDPTFPSLCMPGSLSPKSLGISMLRSERVLQWMRVRGRACQTLYLDFSNINHDFDGRRFEVLLSLAPSVRTLHIVNMFGPGPSEFPEVFLSLQQLERLHIEGFPAQFLVTAAPYLKALPNLQHLHFKSDSPSCPTAIGPLPPSLQSLELEGMWIEEWPSNMPRAFSASDAASPVGRSRSGRSATLQSVHSAPLQQLQHISLHSCHFAPGLFAELMSTEGTPSLSFIWCTLVRLSLDDVPHIFPDIHPPPHHRISPGSPISVVKLHKVQPSLTSLTYVGCGLEVLRPEITSCLQHLQHLNLSQSPLGHPEAFPDEFRLLDKLTSLDLSECSLVVLPPNVAALTTLKHINLENNALTGLPQQIAFAHSLRSAQLAYNRLPALPQCLLEDAKGLERLTVSSGVIAGTPLHVLDNVFLQLPNLLQLSVKGDKFESRAVHNLLRLSKRISQCGALLYIDVTPSE